MQNGLEPAAAVPVCRRGRRLPRFYSLSAPGGGEGRGEVGDSSALADTHLTLPIAARRVPSLSALKGGEGFTQLSPLRDLTRLVEHRNQVVLGGISRRARHRAVQHRDFRRVAERLAQRDRFIEAGD